MSDIQKVIDELFIEYADTKDGLQGSGVEYPAMSISGFRNALEALVEQVSLPITRKDTLKKRLLEDPKGKIKTQKQTI